jgi:hypothetical protein
MSLRARAPAPSRLEILAAALIMAAGLALSAWLFYPGLATHDALAVYDQAHAGRFGDWQPPLMGVIWVALENLFGYGPQALFLPVAALYWIGWFLAFVALRGTGAKSARLVLVLPFLPPLFALLGILWRDVIFAVLWLNAIALAALGADRESGWRWLATGLALACLLLGYWLRPNALFAAVPVLAYVLWPRTWRWKRLALMAVPTVALLAFSTSFINYRLLAAQTDNPTHSIFVFDLAGISHFADRNVFPVDDWTPAQVETLKSTCYNPSYWDAMWWPQCTFAMERINRDDPPGSKLFGSERLRDAWLKAILKHPMAYARHRLAFFNALMTGRNMVMFDQDNSGQWRFFFFKRSPYVMLEAAMLRLHEVSPVFRGAIWLLLSVLVGIVGLRMANGRAKAAILALASSGTLYTLTYSVFGVAAEYRYVYWTALSGLLGVAFVLSKWELDRALAAEQVTPAPEAARR